MTGGKTDSDALADASLIIDRFGGIRPMSNKMRVPVTTIQGWKKRGSIPGARRAEILECARQNGIDLSDILSGKSLANENADSMPITIGEDFPDSSRPWHGLKNRSESEGLEEPEEEGDDEPSDPDEEDEELLEEKDDSEGAEDADPGKDRDSEQDEEDEIEDIRPFEKPAFGDYRRTSPSEIHATRSVSVMQDRPYGEGDLSALMDKIKTVEVRSGRHMTLIAGSLVAAALAFVMIIFWPQSGPPPGVPEATKVASVAPEDTGFSSPTEEGLGTADEGFSLFYSGIQSALSDALEESRAIRESLTSVAVQAQGVVSVLTDPDAGPMGPRLEAIGEKVDAMVPSLSLSDFMARIESMMQNEQGQKTVQDVLTRLRSFSAIDSSGSDPEESLNRARAQDPLLNQAFAGVAPEDLKAAALLVGFSQFRSILERGDTPFDKDLPLLLDFVGEDNPELRESLLRLAPQAEKGVLSPAGLMTQFKSMAGEAVMSSLQGDDVSFEERAIARLNDVLQIEKNGELVTGTDTQAKIARARTALDTGDVEGAVAELEGLEGPAAQTARPWIDKAQAVILAGQVKQMVSGFMAMRLHEGGGAKYTARSKGFSGLLPQAPVVHDPESDVLILPEGSAMPKPLSLPTVPNSSASP